jgi:hypothetical protein
MLTLVEPIKTVATTTEKPANITAIKTTYSFLDTRSMAGICLLDTQSTLKKAELTINN